VNLSLSEGDPGLRLEYTCILFGDTGDGKIDQTDVTYCENNLNVIPTKMTPTVFAMTFNANTFYAPITTATRDAVRTASLGSGGISYANCAAEREKVVKAWYEAQGLG
jgi:hypothetical protein